MHQAACLSAVQKLLGKYQEKVIIRLICYEIGGSCTEISWVMANRSGEGTAKLTWTARLTGQNDQ
ncbi:hypothetical protein JCM39068_33420 [Desulfocastanea catecholica]